MKQIATALIVCTLSMSCATVSPSVESDVAVLVEAGIRYSTDGHGGSNTLDRPAVQALLARGRARAVPILIGNLANSTLTDALVNGQIGNVSLGYVCFDVLCHILRPTQWFDEDCGDCGHWARVRPECGIPMQITDENSHEAIVAQKRWQVLLESGDLIVE